MKILFVAVSLDTYEKVPWGLTSDIYHFRKFGNKVREITKKNFWRFLWDYMTFRPDLVIGTGVAGFIPAFFKRIGLVRKPVVHMWDDYYGEQMGRKYGAWPAYFEMFAILNSDHITTVSKYNEMKAKILGKPVTYIPHGVQDKTKQTKIRLTGKVKVVYIGEQSKYKQVDKMIRAVKGLKCDLYLIGKPEEDMKKIALKNVHFVNFVPPEEIPNILKQADILINPADQDSNFKFFEYIRSRRPILALRGRPGYILTHRENAYLTTDFAKGIKTLVNDRKLRQTIIKNMKSLKKDYVLTWKEVALRHLKVYKNLIKK